MNEFTQSRLINLKDKHNVLRQEGLIKLCGLFVIFSLVVSLVTTSTGWAQGRGTPPVKKDCETLFSSNEYNARLDCKTENVNSALFGFVNEVVELDRVRTSIDRPNILSKDQKNNLLSVRDRAQNAKNRTNTAKGFKGAVKKQKAQAEDCYIKEYTGTDAPDENNKDGVCEKGELCEELEDGIGNDDGKCVQKGPKKDREICVQVCEQPLVSDDDNYDSGALEDMEEELTELEDALLYSGTQVEMMTRLEIEAWEQGSFYNAPLSNDCGDFSDTDLILESFKVLEHLQVVKNVAAAAFESCDVVCNQDAFGWNCSAGCLALAIVGGIANGVYDGFDLAYKKDGEIDNAVQMEKLAKCNQANKNTLSILDEKLDNMTAEIGGMNEILGEVQESLILINNLLLTPQGKREDFPLN
jgi:hypothetical protein